MARITRYLDYSFFIRDEKDRFLGNRENSAITALRLGLFILKQTGQPVPVPGCVQC
jgi:hypothetical protein